MKAGWKKLKLGDIAEVQSGGTPLISNRSYWDGGIPWYSSGELNDLYTSPPERQISTAGLEGSNAKLFPKGSLLIGMYDTAALKMSILDRAAAFNQAIVGVKPNEQIDLVFVLHAINSIRDQVLGQRRGVRQKNLSLGKMREIELSVPSLPEQQRIVTILDEAFDGIATVKANAEKNLQNARALFESHLQSVFTQRGEGWVEKRLGDICERVSVGHVGPTSEFYCDQSEGIPFLRSQNVRRGFLDWDGIQYVTKEFHQKLRKSQLQSGDLLFVRVGANRGDCCSLPNDAGEINCANIVFARPTTGNADYLERYCDSTHGREQLLGMTTGSAQGVINTHSVADLIVPIPLPTEQKRIVDSLNEFQAETRRLEAIYQQKLAALDSLKKSLLDQAFTGQL